VLLIEKEGRKTEVEGLQFTKEVQKERGEVNKVSRRREPSLGNRLDGVRGVFSVFKGQWQVGTWGCCVDGSRLRRILALCGGSKVWIIWKKEAPPGLGGRGGGLTTNFSCRHRVKSEAGHEGTGWIKY